MPRRGVVSGLWSVLGARHSLALRPWRHRPHLSLQSGPRWPGPRWHTPDAVFLQLLCSDGPWRRERSSADGWPGPKFCPSHARRGVSASQSGAQDTGAQLLGPSVVPLLPWGRPGKADPVSPSCGPPISSQGLSGDPAGRPLWFSRPWLAPSCSPQARLQLRGVTRGHCPQSSKGEKVLWKILG